MKFKIGDLVRRRGIISRNPTLGIIIEGPWDKYDLVTVKWTKSVYYHEDTLIGVEHPHMLEVVKKNF